MPRSSPIHLGALRVSCLLLLVLTMRPGRASADWPTDSTVNVPICTVAGGQIDVVITTDGLDGAIVAWEDYRSGLADIYAQRANSAGQILWTTNGEPLCTAAGNQVFPAIAPDGSGGAIVAWADGRAGAGGVQIYAQHVSANGAPLWATNGVQVCAQAGNQSNARLVPDGAGGAIIAWLNSNTGHPYGQRVSGAGTALWPAGGVAFALGTGSQTQTAMCSDGAGGAILAWQDSRSSTIRIFAQRLDATGAIPAGWAPNGDSLCTASGSQQSPAIVSDGAGGAIVVWRDFRVDPAADLYAQRIGPAGAPLWGLSGVAVCTAANGQDSQVLATDGAGGAIATWEDGRSGTGIQVFAQRLSAGGVAQWTSNGVSLCANPGNQRYPTILADGASGAVVAWQDFRDGTSNTDVYSQRVSAAGAVEWSPNGVAVSTAANNQQSQVMVSDGRSGAILAWWDLRNSTIDYDVYAQRVDASGDLGVAAVPLASTPGEAWLAPPVPDPARGESVLRFAVPRAARVRLAIYDLAGRLVRTLVDGPLPAGESAARWDGRDDAGRPLPSALYLCRLEAGGRSLTRKLSRLR